PFRLGERGARWDVPLRQRSIGNAAHSGSCAASSRRTTPASVWTSSTCIFRSAKPPSPRDAEQVFLPVERVVVRPLPDRRVSSHPLVTGKARLEHALPTRQSRQLPLEVMITRRGLDRLDR